MKQKNINTILSNLNKISSYPLYYLLQGNLIFPEHAIDVPFLCEHNLLNDLLQVDHQSSAYLVADPLFPDYFYGIICLTEDSVIIVGPVCAYKLSRNQIVEYMKQYHMHDFMNYQITHATISQIKAILELIAAYLFQDEIDIQNLCLKPSQDNSINDHNLSSYRLSQSEQSKQHGSYMYEQELFSYIANGQTDLLKTAFSNSPMYEIGTLASSEIKQEEYAAVVAVTFASSAAIDGGMNPYNAHDLCNVYLQQISNASEPKEYRQILSNAMIQFTTEVNSLKNKNKDTLHIEHAKEFIIRHLNKPFKLQDIADYVGVTPAYLSNYFSVQTNMTLKEYTCIERIRAAQNMLRFSDYSLGVIANYLCFCSQSYFCAQFKKVTGMTPQQYRHLNKR